MSVFRLGVNVVIDTTIATIEDYGSDYTHLRPRYFDLCMRVCTRVCVCTLHVYMIVFLHLNYAIMVFPQISTYCLNTLRDGIFKGEGVEWGEGGCGGWEGIKVLIFLKEGELVDSQKYHRWLFDECCWRYGDGLFQGNIILVLQFKRREYENIKPAQIISPAYTQRHLDA